MSKFLAQKYEALTPYVPGEQPKTEILVKLNTNENPYPPSPAVLKALSEGEASKLRLYPDPEAKELVRAIGKYYKVAENRIFVGNGSDEALAFVFMGFQNEERQFYFPDISYGFYRVYAEVFGVCSHSIPLDEEFRIRVEDYRGLFGTIVIANPNAPTGIALSRKEIEQILKANSNNLVVVDEAYVDFGGESSIPLVDQYENLLVIQTLSKSRNLAGSRVGFAIGHEEIIGDMNKLKFSFNPYNVNRLSVIAGATAINDRAYFDACVKRIKEGRETLTSGMKSMGFSVLPSKANFIFVRHEQMGGEFYYNRLREKGIIVRHFQDERIREYVRITIGTQEQMQVLLTATAEILAEE